MAVVQTGVLPGGVVLGREESVLRSERFLASNIFIFLRFQLALTNRRLTGQRPNTILGFIPVGSSKVTYPLTGIAGINTTSRVSALRLLLGLALGLAGFSNMGTSTSNAVVLMLVGALLVLSSYYASLQITNSGGGTINHVISVFDKGRAAAFCEEVNTVLAERV